MAGMVSNQDTKITFDVYSRCFDEIDQISDDHLDIAIKNLLPIIRFWELEVKRNDKKHDLEMKKADSQAEKMYVHQKNHCSIVYGKSTLSIMKLARETMIEERKKRKNG